MKSNEQTSINNMEQQKGLKHGAYIIVWEEGGASIASIGHTHDGTNWFAPCNWTSKDNEKPIVASTQWEQVRSIRLIMANEYKKVEETRKL